MQTAEYRDLSAAEIIAQLSAPTPTLVLCHARPDADALGSAMALSLWLQKREAPRTLCVRTRSPSACVF